jgi:hypothetical protein
LDNLVRQVQTGRSCPAFLLDVSQMLLSAWADVRHRCLACMCFFLRNPSTMSTSTCRPLTIVPPSRPLPQPLVNYSNTRRPLFVVCPFRPSPYQYSCLPICPHIRTSRRLSLRP